MAKKNRKKKQPWQSNFIKIIAHVVVFVVVVVLLNAAFGSVRKRLVMHTYNWDPETYVYGINPMKQSIGSQQARYLLLGNSTLRQGIVLDSFVRQTQVPSIKVYFGGSGAAWWYLTVKNVISKLPQKPEKLFVFFHDYELTDTQQGIKGKYQPVADMTSLPYEPLDDRLSFMDTMTADSHFLNMNLVMYQKKEKFKTQFNTWVKGMAPTKNKAIKLNEAIAASFADSLMDTEIYDMYLTRDLKVKASKSFRKAYKHSYLPEILRICKKARIEPVFVRIKKKNNFVPDAERADFLPYITDLKEFMEDEAYTLLDFSAAPELTDELFADGSHLNPDGQIVFTKLLSEKVKQVFNPKPDARAKQQKFKSVGI